VCFSAYSHMPYSPCHYLYIPFVSLHLLSTNHRSTQPCYFPLLLKPAAQKEKMDCNSLTMSSRLRVTLVAHSCGVMESSTVLFRRESS
jgi:hypothetical protein